MEFSSSSSRLRYATTGEQTEREISSGQTYLYRFLVEEWIFMLRGEQWCDDFVVSPQLFDLNEREFSFNARWGWTRGDRKKFPLKFNQPQPRLEFRKQNSRHRCRLLPLSSLQLCAAATRFYISATDFGESGLIAAACRPSDRIIEARRNFYWRTRSCILFFLLDVTICHWSVAVCLF